MKTQKMLITAICGISSLASSCKSLCPEYPHDKQYTRNETDDSFLVQAMRYNMATADMAETALHTSDDTGMKAIAADVLNSTAHEKDKLKSLALGAVLLPEQYDQRYMKTKSEIKAERQAIRQRLFTLSTNHIQ